MKRKGLIFAAVALLVIVVTLLAGGPLLNAMGVEVICISEEDGRRAL